MTALEYERIVGQKPTDDDLERVNCSKVGLLGHQSCGWCHVNDKPRFMCGCTIKSLTGQGHKDMMVDTAQNEKSKNNDDEKHDSKNTLLEFYADRPAKEIINADDLQDMTSIIMDMADTTSDRGLKRYLFNAIDHLGAAHLYLQKYPASAKISEFWQKHKFNEDL